MASTFYNELLPDYEDLENRTGERPGFEVNVVEQDGGIGLLLNPPAGLVGAGVGRAQVFMTLAQAQALVNGLVRAIERAATKQPA